MTLVKRYYLYFLRKIVITLLVLFIFFSLPFLCRSHGHGHGGGHSHKEAPAFKYSKEANEIFEDDMKDEYQHAHHVHDHRNNDHEHPATKYSREVNKLYDHDHEGHSHEHLHKQAGHTHGHDHSQSHIESHGREEVSHFRKSQEDTLTLWAEAIGSTLLISAAPFFILFFIPLDKSEESKPLLKLLLSFASGGLLGDAFLHLIPHALMSHADGDSHSHSHSHSTGSHSHGEGESGYHGHDLSVGLWTLCGIVAFLVVEKFVRIMKGGHGHSHLDLVKEPECIDRNKDGEKSENSVTKDTDSKDSEVKENEEEEKPAKDEVVMNAEKEKQEDEISTENLKTEEKEVTEGEKHNKEAVVFNDADGDIMVSGYLNLAADFTHNFTDGLAIGASYLAGRSIGIITTITILLHEVPHEIGDFAILVKSGCTKKKAIWLQLSTAVGAVIGTILSLLAEGIGAVATAWILPFTAGGFIYIATVSVIPDLLQDTKFWQSVKEILALLFGVFMMVLIAKYE